MRHVLAGAILTAVGLIVWGTVQMRRVRLRRRERSQ
jgi:hypothetical protein